MNKVMIIAEAGVNHNGSVEMAKKLVQAACVAGADAVKFQTFRTEAIITASAAKAVYQKQTTSDTESQFEMVKKLELSDHAFELIHEHCNACGIKFLSTAFDLSSIDFLQQLNLPLWKIPSGEITNLPYLRKIGSLGQPVILSTGMSELEEIAAALAVLESSGTAPEKVTLLHCNTEYPTPMTDVNLAALATLRRCFPRLNGVGYSDHTLGIEVAIAAVAMGASVIEKHFTLDRSLPGPDHRASLEPDELIGMVRAIRNIELALGSGEKTITPSERKNRSIARKSIVAATQIAAGAVFTSENLAVKRPGSGVCPMRWDEVLGQIARRNYDVDEMIDA